MTMEEEAIINTKESIRNYLDKRGFITYGKIDVKEPFLFHIDKKYCVKVKVLKKPKDKNLDIKQFKKDNKNLFRFETFLINIEDLI